MVLDSSAVVAIHLKEPGYERLIEKIETAEAVAIGLPTVLESAMVLTTRLGRDARPLLTASLRRMEAETVPFTEEHMNAAMEAFIRFGRGRHRAALNFGDCMSYAVAAVAGHPLLYTGKDFAGTDIPKA